jgi:hypothetical protein
MPTRIIFSNGESVTVSDSIESVAEALGGGSLAKLERPWGDTSIYVNSSEVLYIEAETERAPDIEALEAESPPAASPPPASAAPAAAPRGPAPGTPGGPAVQPPPGSGYPQR